MVHPRKPGLAVGISIPDLDPSPPLLTFDMVPDIASPTTRPTQQENLFRIPSAAHTGEVSRESPKAKSLA